MRGPRQGPDVRAPHAEGPGVLDKVTFIFFTIKKKKNVSTL